MGPVSIVHHLSEESSRLLVVIVGVLMGISASSALNWVLVPRKLLVLNRTGCSSGFVVFRATTTAIDAHRAVTNVVGTHASAVRAVDWNLVVVCTKAVAMGDWIVQQATLKHLVHRGFNAWNQMRWSVCNLLSLGMEIFRISVEHNLADWFKRIVAMGPYFSHVVDIESVFVSVSKRHNLYEPVPSGSTAIQQCFVEVSGCKVLVLHTLLCSLCIREVFDTLSCLEVVLNQKWLSLCVDPLEGMGAVAIHVPVAVRSASIGKENHNLVLSLRRVTPEVEGHVWILDSRLWMALLRVNEVWELDWVLDEEDRRVVADHVVVAFFGVELDCKSTRITVTVVSTPFTCNG